MRKINSETPRTKKNVFKYNGKIAQYGDLKLISESQQCENCGKTFGEHFGAYCKEPKEMKDPNA